MIGLNRGPPVETPRKGRHYRQPRCLEGVDRAGITAALRRYEANRQERTARMQRTSRQNAWGKSAIDPEWVYGYNAWTAELA